jgi:hypothetical protein
MDFQFSDEQRLLKDSVDRLIGPAYDDLGHRRKMQSTELGYDEGLWAKYAELGLLALPFSEEEGGFGGGTVETMIVSDWPRPGPGAVPGWYHPGWQPDPPGCECRAARRIGAANRRWLYAPRLRPY